MTNWFKKGVSLAYFKRKRLYVKNKWVRLRNISQSIKLSTDAKKRLEWIIFYNTVGKCNAKLTAEYFGISRKTLHKYLKRFNEANLRTLEEHSKSPITKRVWTVNSTEEQRVIDIRNFSKCKWGKAKIAKRYSDIYGEKISTNKVQKIINRHNLYADTKMRLSRLKKGETGKTNFYYRF